MTTDSLDLRPLRLSLLLALGLGAACGDKPDDEETGTSGTDDTSTASACGGSTPVLDDAGQPTGIERCADGALHRVSAEATATNLDAEPACQGDEAWPSCTTDAECTDGAHGKCIHYDDQWGDGTSCGCVYACESDADCTAGRVCLPTGIVETGRASSTCVQATCTTDADCASGECGVSTWHDGCGWNPRLACRAAEDGCRVDGDCGGDQSCTPAYGEGYTCHGQECDIGRPLLVAGAARVAPAVRRADWRAALGPRRPEDPAQRAALAARWARIGALEHASVASFARFTLQMMALGAPADLLRDIQQAALDEVRHAELAYGLASAYGGAPVGPGPLALADAAPSLDRASVVRALVAEACVGETIGAAEAREKAAAEPDPAVAAVLAEIAADEARHAALAWRSLQWVLAQDPALVEVAAATLAETAEALATTPLRRAVIAQVVIPTAAALGLHAPAALDAVA